MLADSLHTRVPGHWPYVAYSIPRVVPLVARGALHRPTLSWDEVKFAVYVTEWDRFLRTRPEYRRAVTVLDQGPVFGLARLLWGRKPLTGSSAFRSWMHRMIEHWSDALDLLAWLDAPDDVLLGRIDHRAQLHEAKGRPMQEALGLIATHREAYEEVLAEIDRAGRLRVERFDTSTLRPGEIAAAIGDMLVPGARRELTDVA